MIKTRDITPSIYYDRSRDFQLFGRLFDVVLNFTKASTDMIYTVPDGEYAGSAMVDLLASTLGFKKKHEYSVSQLVSVCSILPLILRKKGSKEALELVCSAILRGDGNKSNFYINPMNPTDSNNNTTWIVLIPKLKSIALLQDLMDYILPVGTSCILAEGNDTKTTGTENFVEPTHALGIVSTDINFNKLLNSEDFSGAEVRDTVLKNTFIPGLDDGTMYGYNADGEVQIEDITNATIIGRTQRPASTTNTETPN